MNSSRWKDLNDEELSAACNNALFARDKQLDDLEARIVEREQALSRLISLKKEVESSEEALDRLTTRVKLTRMGLQSAYATAAELVLERTNRGI